MYIKRLFSTVIKCPTSYKCLPVCECEIEFNKIIKELNITIVSLNIEKKEDEKKEKEKERCD